MRGATQLLNEGAGLHKARVAEAVRDSVKAVNAANVLAHRTAILTPDETLATLLQVRARHLGAQRQASLRKAAKALAGLAAQPKK